MRTLALCCLFVACLMVPKQAKASCPTGCTLTCCTGIACSGGYSCQHKTTKYYCDCPGTCEDVGKVNCTAMAQAPSTKKAGTLIASASAAKTNWAMKVLDLIATPVAATNCWSGGNNKGIRNGVDQTGSGWSSKQCEAKLHVCYTNGASDSGIPCTINTTSSCDNACNNTTTASQVACSYSDCTSRCYAARVSGYSDTCN